jgi:hypothetical protein
VWREGSGASPLRRIPTPLRQVYVSRDTLIESLREGIAEYAATVRAAAKPDCRICRGQGWTDNYVAPSKMSRCECPCTGYGYNRPRE